MDFTGVSAVAIPEGNVLRILCGTEVLWEKPSSYTNQVPISIDTDGNVYNGTGYKNGYRLSSSGGESEAAYCAVTGFIKAKAGDTIRIKGYQWVGSGQSTCYIGTYDENFAKVYMGNAIGSYHTATIIESSAYDATTGINTIVLKSGVSYEYIRLSVFYSDHADGANLIVTINEPIT